MRSIAIIGDSEAIHWRTNGSKEGMRAVEWNYDTMCFACGEQNPSGLKLKFEIIDEQTVRTVFIPKELQQGFPGIMHGGLTATILDELMARAVNALIGYYGLTARLEIRYRKPVPIGEPITFEAKIVNRRRSIVDLEAKGMLPNGELVAEATSRFMLTEEY